MVTEGVEARQPTAAHVIQEVAPAPGHHFQYGAPATEQTSVFIMEGVYNLQNSTVLFCLQHTYPYYSSKASVQLPGATKTVSNLLCLLAIQLILFEAKDMLNFDKIYNSFAIFLLKSIGSAATLW